MEDSTQTRTIAGTFRLEKRLDSSGAFQTYQASGTGGRTVVVKVLPAPSPETVARLTQLLRVSGPAHPNLVPVLDWGEDDGDFYVVRDYVAGTDLKTVVQATGPLDVPHATMYAKQAASALAALHSNGLVHGNVKTANLLVPAGSEEIRLVGLGTAAAGTAPDPGPGEAPSSAAYLSPEQIRGQAATPRSDVYSLGAVLYELLTGRPPFDGINAGEVAQRHLTMPLVPPSQLKPGIPPAVEEVVERALQKDPAARYGSAEEMRQALGFVTGPLPAPPPQKRKLWPILLGAAVVLALLAALAISWATGNSADVPDLSGLTLAEATAALQEAQLGLGDVTYQPDPPQDAELGTVIGQTPAAAERVKEDSRVAVTIAGQKQVQVPEVVGQEEAQAARTLQESGLNVGDVTRTESETVPSGTVIAQTPAAGETQPEGTNVALTVSSGPPQAQVAEVPDVVGQTQSTATRALEGAGFSVSVSQSYSTSVPSGNVISQSPEGGSTFQPGGTVTLTVSQGALPYSQVPNVVGQSQDQATQSLRDAGFQVTTSQAYSSSTPAGNVMDQSPPGGVFTKNGSTVSLVVSQGSPPADAVAVPDVAGQSAEDASQALIAAGFKVDTVQVYSSSVAEGNVAAQGPAAGAQAPPGATVTIAVSLGPTPSTTPTPEGSTPSTT